MVVDENGNPVGAATYEVAAAAGKASTAGAQASADGRIRLRGLDQRLGFVAEVDGFRERPGERLGWDMRKEFAHGVLLRVS